MCVAYVFMWVCGCEYMCVRVGMWKPEVVAGSLPPSLSVLFLCVHRMHVHSHVCWCTCGCKGTRRSEVDAGCLPPPLSTSCLEDLSLNLDLIVSAQLCGPWLQGAARLCLGSSSGVPGAHRGTQLLCGGQGSKLRPSRLCGSSLHTGSSLQRSGPFLVVSVSPRKG